jgi:hypothetical protein
MCHQWLEQQLGARRALLTHSCTAALEMAAILCDIRPGDEVIMPSYTFVSTANAFVLRGGVPVFVDIRPDTLNLDETLIEAAITPKTRAIVPVHYAGVACDMDAIMAIARRRNLLVVVERDDDVSWLSLRNVPSVHLLVHDQLNTYDVLLSDDVVFTKASIDTFLDGAPRGKSVKAVASESEIDGSDA